MLLRRAERVGTHGSEERKEGGDDCSRRALLHTRQSNEKGLGAAGSENVVRTETTTERGRLSWRWLGTNGGVHCE